MTFEDKRNLKENIISAWHRNIPTMYSKGLICSERHLQAILYHYLLTCLPKTYVVWVEPTIAKRRYPDLIITRDREVVALIELKYTPSQYVRLTDGDKLKMLYKDFCLELDPLTGKRNNNLYNVPQDTLKIFGVIGRNGSYALTNKPWDYIDENWILLQMIGSCI